MSTDDGSSQSETKEGVSVGTYLSANRSLLFLFFTRLATIISAICAALPIFAGNTHPTVWYYRAHMGSAATSFLRLTQIIQTENVPLGFNRATLTNLLAKDAVHYLIFSVMFMSTTPVSLSMIPVVIFALLHVCSFINKLLQSTHLSIGLAQKMVDKVVVNQAFLLQVIALNEIMIMPVVVITVLTGGGLIFLPFIYYRFICLRYSSLRNPYSKNVFVQLRFSVEQMCASPSCPRFASGILLKMRDLVMRLAPQ